MRFFSIVNVSLMRVDWRRICARNIIVGRTRCIALHRQSCAQTAARISLEQSVVNAKKPTILLPSRIDAGCEAFLDVRRFNPLATSTTRLPSTHIR